MAPSPINSRTSYWPSLVPGTIGTGPDYEVRRREDDLLEQYSFQRERVARAAAGSSCITRRHLVGSRQKQAARCRKLGGEGAVAGDGPGPRVGRVCSGAWVVIPHSDTLAWRELGACDGEARTAVHGPRAGQAGSRGRRRAGTRGRPPRRARWDRFGSWHRAWDG